MANWWQVQRLRRGVKGWNAWREKHPNVTPDLSMANLSNTNLHDICVIKAHAKGRPHASLLNHLHELALPGSLPLRSQIVDTPNSVEGRHWFLVGVNLRGANLREVKLKGADLRNADLAGADLRNATLSRADLYNANLSEADLSSADLTDAHFSNTNLTAANLVDALCFRTAFLDIDLSTIKGLAQMRHRGPSSIHLPSLRLPQDGSALHFLRGVGLNDEQIDAWRATTMLPIQYHSVFISYSSKDEILAHRLHADLQAHGVRCWFAPEDMKIGNKIRNRIDQAIHLQERSLLLLSEHSIASTWVEHEVEAVLETEDRQKREILFPVRLDDGVMHTTEAWAATLRRTRHIGNFTKWTDPCTYQSAFERLLQDLKK